MWCYSTSVKIILQYRLQIETFGFWQRQRKWILTFRITGGWLTRTLGVWKDGSQVLLDHVKMSVFPLGARLMLQIEQTTTITQCDLAQRRLCAQINLHLSEPTDTHLSPQRPFLSYCWLNRCKLTVLDIVYIMGSIQYSTVNVGLISEELRL